MGTWPMWGGEPTHQSVQLLKGAITTPVIKWRFATGGAVEWQFSAIADVDGDGATEVVIGSASAAGKIYCLRGWDGTQKWAYTPNSVVYCSPTVADVDEDGRPDVVVGAWNGKVYCLAGTDGTLKWRFITNTRVHNPGALVDIDGDDKLEYLVSQQDRSILYCLNAEDGTLAWQIDLAQDVHSPFAGDIDGDGCAEIILGTMSADAHGYRVFAIDDPETPRVAVSYTRMLRRASSERGLSSGPRAKTYTSSCQSLLRYPSRYTTRRADSSRGYTTDS